MAVDTAPRISTATGGHLNPILELAAPALADTALARWVHPRSEARIRYAEGYLADLLVGGMLGADATVRIVRDEHGDVVAAAAWTVCTTPGGHDDPAPPLDPEQPRTGWLRTQLAHQHPDDPHDHLLWLVIHPLWRQGPALLSDPQHQPTGASRRGPVPTYLVLPDAMTELATQAGYDSTGKGICTPQGGVLLRAWWRPGAPVAHEPAPARSADDDPPSGAFMNIPHRPATPTGTAAIQDRSARAELTATDRTGTRRAVPGNTSNRPELPAAAAARHRSGGTSDIGARGTSDNAIRTTSPEAGRSPQPPDGRRPFPSRRADAIARYKAGETIGKIAAALGVRPRTISKWLPAEVVTEVVTQRAQDAEALREAAKAAAITRYEAGETIDEIAAALLRSPTTVRLLLPAELVTQRAQDAEALREAAKAAAITRYEAGETIREVATVLGKEPETVSGWLTGAGVAIRRGTLTEEQREDLQAAAAARYESGETISEIAADYGRSDGSVRNLLLGAGVQLRPPGGGRRQLIPHDQPAGL